MQRKYDCELKQLPNYVKWQSGIKDVLKLYLKRAAKRASCFKRAFRHLGVSKNTTWVLCCNINETVASVDNLYYALIIGDSKVKEIRFLTYATEGSMYLEVNKINLKLIYSYLREIRQANVGPKIKQTIILKSKSMQNIFTVWSVG